MKRVYLESAIACIVNAVLVVSSIILTMNDHSVLITNVLLLLAFIFEILLYIKKNREEKLAYSLTFLAISVSISMLLLIYSVYFLHSACLPEYRETAKLYIRYIPYVYIYPAFIYPSGICSVIYCNLGKIKKLFLATVFCLVTLAIPQIIYR